MLDYLAVERADEAVHARDRRRAEGAAPRQAGVEIPGGEVAVLPELIRGHPSPHGFDLTAACFGTVALDAVVTGAALAPGDALIGLPSAGLHSNGYSLARRALLGRRRPRARRRAARLGGASRRRRAARADGDLRARGARAAALGRRRARPRAHHRRRAAEPAAPARRRRLRDRRPAARSRRCSGSCASCGDVAEPEMWEVFNMGCGFVVVVPEADEAAAVELLARHHPGARADRHGHRRGRPHHGPVARHRRRARRPRGLVLARAVVG